MFRHALLQALLRITLLCILTLTTAPPPGAAERDPGRDGSAGAPGTPRAGSPPSAFASPLDGRIAIGDRVPDFALDDARGGSVRLSRLRGQWVVLVFAGRREALAALDSVAHALHGRNARVVAVCVDRAHTLTGLERRSPHLLTALADPTGEVTALFGLWDAATRTAAPGFVLADPQGITRLALLGRALPPAELLELVEYAMAEPS
jgi:peroxiredoxin